MTSAMVKRGPRGARGAQGWARAAARVLACGALSWHGSVAPAAQSGGETVVIEGGADASGQQYAWTVTNRGSTPIVWIEFPHYHADAFMAPAKWKKETTHLNIAGSKDLPGVCRASVDSPDLGIGPNRSAEFQMRVSNAGAARRLGEVKVRFADGREMTIGDVELPSPLSRGEQYQMLIGLAVIFGLILLVNARRKRSPKAPGPPA